MDIISTAFAHAVVISAAAVIAVQQIMKFKIVPVKVANEYPVPTLIVLSILAAIGVDLNNMVQPHAWTDWVVLVMTIGVAAALTYNHTLKNWAQLRAMEG